jgi:uracil-DNA glycosylase
VQRPSREGPLAALLPAAWKGPLSPELHSASFHALQDFLAGEDAAGVSVWPPRDRVFAALEHVAPSGVKVVVLGQDPYPTAGVANGLAFSVHPGVKVPASLRNLFKALVQDAGIPLPTSGDLTPWARQGVLLLNTVLTVREGAPNSHRGRGWEPLTEAVLRVVNAQAKPVVFLCLGRQAQQLAQALVDGRKHALIHTPHPSPLTGRSFMDAVVRERPFQRLNQLLVEAGHTPIEWAL